MQFLSLKSSIRLVEFQEVEFLFHGGASGGALLFIIPQLLGKVQFLVMQWLEKADEVHQVQFL